jgi:hypothetical protein
LLQILVAVRICSEDLRFEDGAFFAEESFSVNR